MFCKCEKRLAKLEKEVERLRNEKQNTMLDMGLKPAYQRVADSGCIGWAYGTEDRSRYYQSASVEELVRMILAHLRLKFVETAGEPAKRELVKDAKK